MTFESGMSERRYCAKSDSAVERQIAFAESDRPPFSGLPEDAAAALAAAASLRRVAQGKSLFHQGDAPTHLFQMVTGLVRITQINREGTQTTLRLMGPGDLLGCVAVFQQFPYPASATVLEDTVAMSWSAGQMFELLRQYPPIAESALHFVGQRASEMVQRIVEMSGKRMEQRVASALLRLADQAGTKAHDGIRIEFPVTRHDLAEMAGATYFTISRTLSDWKRRGLVNTSRQCVTILASHRLARIAAGYDP
jgi:CRP/FNR family transcriptional regulator, nitrogen oxide reductase regulator